MISTRTVFVVKLASASDIWLTSTEYKTTLGLAGRSGRVVAPKLIETMSHGYIVVKRSAILCANHRIIRLVSLFAFILNKMLKVVPT